MHLCIYALEYFYLISQLQIILYISKVFITSGLNHCMTKNIRDKVRW